MFAHGVQLMQESLGDSLPADKCLELLRATDGNVTVAINLFLDGGAGDVDSRLPSFEAARSPDRAAAVGARPLPARPRPQRGGVG